MERTAGLEPATSASGTPCAASCATSALLSQPVSRVLSPVDRPGDGHPSRAAVAGGLKHPTCEHRAGNSLAFWACSGRGLPGRPGHPGRRWSLTPPFHPYPPRRAVYSLLHLPSGHPGPALPALPALRSPDFPRHPGKGRRSRPADSSFDARYRRAGTGGEDPRCVYPGQQHTQGPEAVSAASALPGPVPGAESGLGRNQGRARST